MQTKTRQSLDIIERSPSVLMKRVPIPLIQSTRHESESNFLQNNSCRWWLLCVLHLMNHETNKQWMNAEIQKLY